ncbi:FAD-binding oxidoreductase [Actinophytocola oryzae]|uniref:FAD/FMN-containing dehydrogenase n=1 Tax=Actinophytocola oryzae TaxID=502181 RepID=A0A4R7W0V0_9PSEU|nr:BBE domain-containing protein [Actinophytocola oryzae]TDV56022.1 FAD/FMN-containing dehydrogenase [Actinophytocola oryzae]
MDKGITKASSLDADSAVDADALPSNGADSVTAADTFGPFTVKPDDPRYGELITGDNQRWVGAPDYFQLVGSTQQVVDAVQAAVKAGRRIAVRSGGHCYEDFVSNSDVRVVIDMSEMDAVRYDRKMKAFAAEPGARLLDLYATLYKGWGVTLPGGRCYSVGAGGHICGGGDGPLSRRHGLTVDHLYAVEVVVVDKAGKARAVVATREPNDRNRDLWWAHTGGGGGNFGVITRYWLRSPGVTGADPRTALPRPPATVLLNGMSFSWAELTEATFATLVKNFSGWHERNSAPSSPGVALSASLALNHRSNGNVSMFVQVDGDEPNAGQLLDDFVSEVVDGVSVAIRPMSGNAGEYTAMPQLVNAQRLPWFHSVRLLATNAPTLTNPTLRADHKSAYHRQGFTDADLAVIYRHLTSTTIDNPNAMLLLLPYGGNVNAVDPAATAAPHRSAAFQALCQSFWSTPADDAKNLAWVRAFYAELYAATGGVPVPNDHTDGCYVNYPDTDLSDPTYNSSDTPWHDLYYKANYPRLQQVKAKWDPRNVFRHAQSVELPS